MTSRIATTRSPRDQARLPRLSSRYQSTASMARASA
jgi:hypothetical protein